MDTRIDEIADRIYRFSTYVPRGNTGSKECRGCAIDSAIPTTRDLVQTAKSQPASREDPIDFRNAKG